jgi:hypothetical protein
MVGRNVLRASSRRLIGAGAAVVVLAVLAVTGAAPAFAIPCGGGQGQYLVLGCDNNSSTFTTVLNVASPSTYALSVKETGTGGAGIAAQGTIYGVYGSGTNYGVYGSGGSGTSVGVQGSGYTGVSGSGSVYGVHGSGPLGVLAESSTATGLGLEVNGRSMFSTAGTAVVASGQKKVTVTLAGVTATDFVLATVQGTGSFYVKNASAGSGSFSITINKAPTSPNTVTVAYFVISAS